MLAGTLGRCNMLTNDNNVRVTGEDVVSTQNVFLLADEAHGEAVLEHTFADKKDKLAHRSVSVQFGQTHVRIKGRGQLCARKGDRACEVHDSKDEHEPAQDHFAVRVEYQQQKKADILGADEDFAEGERVEVVRREVKNQIRQGILIDGNSLVGQCQHDHIEQHTCGHE